MKFIKSKKGISLLAVIAVVAIAAVGAYAYFTTTGSGVGAASVGTSSAALTITQVGTITNLKPGGPSQPIEYKIVNPAANGDQFVGPVTVSFGNADISGVNDTNSGPGTTCTTADFTLVQPTKTPGEIDAGVTYDSSITGPSGASLALKETGADQDGCKSATVVLHFAA
jgi:hypothetical protein